MTVAAARLVQLRARVASRPLTPRLGQVARLSGPLAEAHLDGLGLGATCDIDTPSGRVPAEVVALDGTIARLAPFGALTGVGVGARVRHRPEGLRLPAGPALLGRIIDALGHPLDGGAPIQAPARPIDAPAPDSAARPLVSDPLWTGLRAIDGPLLLGRGQRVALLGPPGTGKSSLLAAIASGAQADAIVVALVGERGREVREFTDRLLPAHARSRMAVIAATSDRPAVERVLAARSALTAAEALRDAGLSVLLVMDSLTRVARALREIGLAAGEPPAYRGYPASVYPALPALIERAGRTDRGDITAIFTVLTEGAEDDDPIASEVRSLTDGHILLSPERAAAGRFPAVDVRASVSRTMPACASPDHLAAATRLRRRLADWADVELLVRLGEYKSGSDPASDAAIAAEPKIEAFLTQDVTKPMASADILAQLEEASA